jgi:hypothetical protein
MDSTLLQALPLRFLPPPTPFIMYYDGEYENGVYHGAGQFAEEDGSLYCGSWSKGLRCGQGSLPSLYYCNIWLGAGKAARSTTESATSTHPAPKISTGCLYRFDAVNRYQGLFLDDLYHGTGKCTWVNGSVYDGAWIMGNPNGIGLYVRLCISFLPQI